MENRGGVWFNGYPVACPHVVEIQRGQYGYDRCAGSLVAPDLAVRRVAHIVGVVDHLHGQPEDSILNLPERRVVVLVGVRLLRNCRCHL